MARVTGLVEGIANAIFPRYSSPDTQSNREAMESSLKKRDVGMTVVAMLALVQSALGVLRAFHWFDVSSNLTGLQLLLVPLIGVLALFRAAFVTASRCCMSCSRAQRFSAGVGQDGLALWWQQCRYHLF